jgi:peptidoglycan pentaglycine glycine transferase (the first glycine)
MNWNDQIAALPGAHILQTTQWGLVKQKYGWDVIPQTWYDNNGKLIAAAQVLQRSIQLKGFSARMSILYIPRGPMLDWQDFNLAKKVIIDLEKLAHKKGAIFIKLDPEINGNDIKDKLDQAATRDNEKIINLFEERGWLYSNEQIQFKNTVWLDLKPSEDTILGNMKQKTRYNIRLAERNGVNIRSGTTKDLHQLYQMYVETSVRDGFVIRPEDYYQTVWNTFMEQHMAEPIIAEVDGEPVAGLFLFYFANKAWYLYGMSRQIHREKMPNHLLQWHAIRRAKSHGCVIYDLWGAPDILNNTDPLWGVYRFKEGFGGKLIKTQGARDFASRPWLYKLYTQILPNILSLMRQRGKERTSQLLST